MNVPPIAAVPQSASARDTELRNVAQELEANFLAEMLKNAGLTAREGEFGGGVGEEAFSGMLTQKYAAAMAQSGGIGLAEWIYASLAKKDGR